jgi:type I restriction enzyme, S subunit
MANRIVKIENICHVVKGETGIMKAIPGEYPMVGLSEERKTHNEYQFDCEAVIIPLVSSTGHGHASIKRIHYQKGKFALGSILCALVPKNEGEYDPEYLYHILDMGKERIFVPLMKGMANVSLPLNRIKSVEINLPPYDKQVMLSKIYSEVTASLDLLRIQTEKQHNYLKQLRQSILQMAVQGKLTTKWREENPNVEPASVLFVKIKSEKEQLIKDGKIRREKPLPEIKDGEKLFELPEKWKWLRLGEILKISSGDGLTSIQMDNSGKIPVFGGNGINGYHTEFNVQKATIVIGRVGAYCGSIHITDERAWVTDNAFITYYSSLINQDWLFYELMGLNLRNCARESAQPVISGERVYPVVLGLPPHEEQKQTAFLVKSLLSLCNELEKKIEKQDSYQGRIMQAIVKQAFTTIND